MLIIIGLLFFESLILNLLIHSGFLIAETDAVAVCFILFNSLVVSLVFMVRKEEENGIDYFNGYLTASYWIRVLFLFWDRYFRGIFTFPNSGLDTGSFDRWANEIIANELTGAQGYESVVAYIYRLFYSNPLWGQYINVLAAAFTILFVYKSLCRMDIGKKHKKAAILLICFLPNYLIMSAILLRESLIALLLAIALWAVTEWWFDNKGKQIIIAFLCILGASYLHSGTIAYFIALGLTLAFVSNKDRVFRFKLKTVLIAAFSLLVFLFLYTYYGDTFFGYMGGIDSAEDVVNRSATYNTGGSGYSGSIVEDDSIMGLILNTPVRMIYFFLAPLPMDWRGIGDVIAFLFSSLFYSVSLLYSLRAVGLNTKNKNYLIMLLIFALASGFIYSWGVSNSGTALRHRDKFVVNFVLLLTVSLDAVKESKRKGENGHLIIE